MTPIKVLLVDDQTLVRQGINSLLQLREHIEVVAQLPDGSGVMEAIKIHQPDIMLLDIRMPVMNGLEVLEVMKADGIKLPTLILTTFDEHELVLQCIELGALGYLRKDVSLDALIGAIEAIAIGKSWFQPAVTQRHQGVTVQSVEQQTVELTEQLTDGEIQVLRLAAGGYSNNEIAGALHKSLGTVRNNMSFILAKLQVRDRTRAVLKAIEHGLI
ncbi:MAG: response regulator transcription factor [Algicola sp.]|nr:response regulator transcription factor [Algicola sp.]